MKRIFTIFLFSILLQSNAFGAWVVRKSVDGVTSKILSVERTEATLPKGESRMVLRDLPFYLAEGDGLDFTPPSTQYQEILFDDESLPPEAKDFSKDSKNPLLHIKDFASSELRTIVEQGPAANRIVLTILGDGYTLAEKEKFFQDAKRITDDLFGEKTFATYLPLFNVYAVFVPSSESGLSDVKSVDTVFGLYRSPEGSKRAIMPGNTSAIESALALNPNKTHYPIILANDDYYGGLGGRYAITTRSVRSGSIVLRHELGHNFGNIGEEYDGGQVYTGANFSSAAAVPWKHWVDGAVSVNILSNLYGDYMWKNLSSTSHVASINLPADAASLMVKISAVGWETPEDVHVMLDGARMSLKGEYTDDRTFFMMDSPVGLKAGKHTLEFKENIHDGDNVLAYVRAYGVPSGYNFEPGVIGAFNVFDQFGLKRGYRPTHGHCLMREMETKDFCAPDIENMWIRFLNQVSILDGVTVKDGVAHALSATLKGLDLFWYKKQAGVWVEFADYRGKSELPLGVGPVSEYKLVAKFSTPEVRKPTSRFETSKEFKF